MNVNDNDDRDILSDSHRSYMIRFIEWENLRQERVSKLFLQSKLNASIGRFDEHVEPSTGRVEGEQPTIAVADQDSAIVSDVQTERSPAGVGDDCGLAAVGCDSQDATVLETRPQLAGGVDDDILGSIPGERDDGNARL